jgi:hypothetical protein
MSDEALWDDLLRVAQEHARRETQPPFEEAFKAVARTLAICHRLGLEAPGKDLMTRSAYQDGELKEFFLGVWRLATMHIEQRRVGELEARGGVDLDASDFNALRDTLHSARAAILGFGWLPESTKRRQLDRLEAMLSELQRARDDFDVGLVGVSDPEVARTIEIGRPAPVADLTTRLMVALGLKRADAPTPAPAKALPPPDHRRRAS